MIAETNINYVTRDNNLLIMFYPGTGGHHLANLFSLSDKYVYPTDLNKYFSTVNRGTQAAHYALHYRDPTLERSVFLYHFATGHLGTSGVSGFGDNLIEKLITMPGTQLVTIHFPINNQLVWNRMSKISGVDLKKFSCLAHLEVVYKQHYLERLYPGNWNTVFADDLFDTTKIDAFLDDLETKLDFNFTNRSLAIKIHTQWLENMYKHNSINN